MSEVPTASVHDGVAGPEPEQVLRRGGPGRMLTGVCAGLGRHTGIDPVLFRVGFAVLIIASGVGLLLYAAAFLLMRRPDGGPGHLEQWTRRLFDAETVLALLAAVFAFGLIINVMTGGIDGGTIVVGTLLAIVLLAAHARGVDLLTMARSMPHRAAGRGMPHATTGPAPDGSPAPEQGHVNPADSSPTVPYGMRPPPAPSPRADEPAAQGAPRTGPQEEAQPPPAREQTPGPTTTALSAHAPPAPPAGPSAGSPFGYRRLSDLAREARADAAGHDAGAPFAPDGPYRPHDPYAGPYFSPDPYDSPYDPYPPPTRPAAKVKAKRPRSFIGGLTICLALIIGGIMVTAQRSSTGSVSLPLIGGAVLVTIGAGLLVAAWIGRGAGLIVTGVMVSLALIAGSTVDGVPEKIGSYVWHPTGTVQPVNHYTLGVGEGRLDLSDVTLQPGAHVTFTVSVTFGQVTVIVPPTARVELHGHARLGEVKIDHKVESGVSVQLDRVLEPEVTGKDDPPTIELRIKAGFGDVEVRRAA